MGAPSATLGSSQHLNWRELYLQALFETNKTKVAALIVDAERALLIREHELFSGPHDPAEREAVNAAIHALHALRSCMGMNAADAAA
jgi:hypothetical protein